MLRAVAVFVSVLLIVAAALSVYVVTGHATTAVRTFARNWGGPVSDDPTTQVITVLPGMSAREIGDELERRKLIRSAFAFRVLIEQLGVGRQLEAGDYEISPSMSTEQVVAVLASGHVRRGSSVTVVEGWRSEEIGARLEALGLAKRVDFLALVRNPEGVVIPEGLPASAGRLEGYLFPATYEWNDKSGLRGLIEAMLKQSDAQIDAKLRAKLERRGLTLEQGVILASIVEREAAREDERAVIASVYENRLKSDMPLQADPTVQFAVANADQAGVASLGFWRPLAAADLAVASPYNTYIAIGLPPGPICNPGLASLAAVADPADTDFLYFVSRGDGSHAFARTAEEHLRNIHKYQS